MWESPCGFSAAGVGFDIMTLRAHFDGTVIVPDEPADSARRLAALERVVARAVEGTNIPLEMLRREHLYEDR